MSRYHSVAVWTRRDPFADFDQTFNALVSRAFAPAVRRPVRPAPFVPAAELARDGQDAVVRLELPGLDIAKDVTVEIDRGRLVVRGERRDARSQNSDSQSIREVRYGSFRRSFAIPEHIPGEAVSARYDAGVLTVRVTGAFAASNPTAQRIDIVAGSAELPAAGPTTEPAPESATDPAPTVSASIEGSGSAADSSATHANSPEAESTEA